MGATKKNSDATRQGALMIIGGAEDRENDKAVLCRLLELTGRATPKVVVLTAASAEPERLWSVYDQAFADLGVQDRVPLAIDSRQQANDDLSASLVREADLVFMTGGDQKRLMAVIGGTALDAELQRGLRERGLCVAGTSAGASVMSDYMVATGEAKAVPERDMVALAAGLGLLQRVVIDQHFSERHRLPRLLALIAQNPALLGLGIDEDTALIVEPERAIEVIGSGAVTVVDGSKMRSNYLDVDRRERLELENVVLNLLPAGARYEADEVIGEEGGDEPLLQFGIGKVVSVLTTVPARGRPKGAGT
jgi:cyanophycinase